MDLSLLPWLGLASQIAGAVALFFAGGLGLGTRPYHGRGAAFGLALFCAGCASWALYAVYDNHVMLAGIQVLAAVAIGVGVARKARDRRGRP